jgi:hypothetical protein
VGSERSIDVPGLTIAFGLVLIGLGVIGYFATGRQSPTALIPAFAGALFLVLGLVAQKPGARKHAMHAAAALAVLGFLGTVSGLIKFFRMLGGEEIDRPAAARSQAIMAVLCVVFVILCVRSFIAARRAREAGFDVAPPTA